MRRKSVKAAGSPDKAAPAPATRRTTRRAKKSPEPEIPKEFLAQSDNSDPSDNDSDYGTPTKKRGGRKLSRATPKKSEEKAPARGRGRGRKAQKELTPEPIAEEEDTENGDNDPPASADHEPASEENEVSVINEQEDAQINNEPVQEELAPEVELVGRSESPEIQAVDSPVAQVQEEEEIQESVDVTVVEDSESEEQEKSVENPEESESETEIVPNIIPEPIQQVPVQSSERSQKIRSRSSSSASSEEVSKSPQQVDSDSKDSSVLSVKETEPMDVDSSMEILNKPKASKAQQIEEVKQKEPEKPSRWNKKPPVVEVQEILEVPEVVEPEQPIPDIKEQEIVEERVANTIQRKRRWKCRQDSETIVAITTDSLKNIISDVEVVPLADVKLDSSPEREVVEEVEKVERRSERPERTKPDDKETKLLQMQRLKDRLRKQEEEEERRLQQNAKNLESIEVTSSAGAALSLNRKVSIVVDDQAPPSPPTQSCSNILFISNLVRPFTVLQLKGLLARTGKIVENGFWIDKIKSKCYVKYESDDQAFETRHALHGVRWPASNPKMLNVDFGSDEEMEKAIVSTMDDMPRIQITTDNVKEEKDFGWSKNAVDERQKSSLTDRAPAVREWDLGKKEDFGKDSERNRSERGTRKRSADREFDRRDRDRRRSASKSQSPARKYKKTEDDPPVRLLDDLFRKTKATPCIYWLPLSAEQIVEKGANKKKQLEEHEKRMEEIRRNRDRNRTARRSNSRDRNRNRNNRR